LVGMRRRAAVEKVKLQEQLWQAQKFDAIGQLAGGIAHDFNNLLLAIIGYSDLLRSKLPADDQAQKDMDAIRKAAEQAASLTHQLLAFARRQVLQPRILDLSEVIGELQPMLRRLISEQIEIDFSLDPMLGAVRADPSQIGQVVVNLAVNARDAMPDGGRLRIETANIELGVDQARRLGIEPGRHVRTTVSDSGCGLEDLVKPYIFDPFFTTKKPGRGSGLGLSTVHGIVTQSNGAIDVKSNPGEGTSFHIYLPRVARAPEAAEEQEKPGDDSQAAAASETVLLVEDQDAVRTLVRQVMSSAGYRLLEAGAGEEALEVAARFDDTIHLLLTDVVLPGMAGPDLARKLQVLQPTMRVLFMTGHAQEAKQREALSEIGDGLLQKPFPPNLLTKKVREILHAQAAARAIE
ncbi:MAG: response regulator, partial [Planctomycetota bacterium]